MAKRHITKLELLKYALEGCRSILGHHPAPDDYPEEIEELDAHLSNLERRIAAHRRGIEQHENAQEGPKSAAGATIVLLEVPRAAR